MASSFLGAPADELNIKKAELRQLLKGVYDIGYKSGLMAELSSDPPDFDNDPKLQNWRDFLDSK